MADTSPPQPIHLSDYQPPAYFTRKVELTFKLDEAETEVVARLEFEGDHARLGGGEPLILNGREVELVGVRLDGRALDEDAYEIGEGTLTISQPPENFTLEITTKIHPEANTALMGLYVSNGIFCTQCEPEGFRRITYFQDRSDVMASYRVRIEGDRKKQPVLLSNGNPVEQGDIDGGRHFAVWDDPFPKPSYLFALVAGNLGVIEDSFTTKSGREVALKIYSEHANMDKCDHAMASLKKSMIWDEKVYGLEYDLDLFQIVAVNDFIFGAMENKGLNVFNTSATLARADTATDTDFNSIERIIAHEYFHNWTGDRVTCRDWFQLSLKEGLTVFRDQQFTADHQSAAVKRIRDVVQLREHQFTEDSGPLAHPIRPDSYVEINNFYTRTVYDKGAEVVRMIHTLVGAEAFRKGMDVYIERHDGQAVTCDDFVAAMETGSGRGLGQFRRWYSQAGTPELVVRGEYDERHKLFDLKIAQTTPPTPGQDDKQAVHIPLSMGLIDSKTGKEIPLNLVDDAAPASLGRVLEVTEEVQLFRFRDVPNDPVPSLLRGFSAPVKLNAGYSEADLAFLLRHDTDPFSRWDAGQSLAISVMLRLLDQRRSGRLLELDELFTEAFGAVLKKGGDDKALLAETLSLPSSSYLGEQQDVVDVEGIFQVLRFVKRQIVNSLRGELLATYRANRSNEPYQFEPQAVGRRRLKNLALAYLMAAPDDEARRATLEQYDHADNMTDTMAALTLLAASDMSERENRLAGFYARWKDDPLVVNKWFALQASTERGDSLETVERLLGHEAFSLTNPNRVRALIGSFCMRNPQGFHRPDGRGYAFLADHVLELDPINAQVAARLLTGLGRWRRYDGARQELMRTELERVLAAPSLSRDCHEIASKSLV